MKILHPKLYVYQNEEWFEFASELRTAIITATPAALNLAALFPALDAGWQKAGKALELIRQSILTKQLAEADLARDHVFSAIRLIVEGQRYSPDAAAAAAAERLYIIIRHYRAIPQENYDKESGSITNFIQDLRTADRAADFAKIGLTGWDKNLEKANQTFIDLMRGRNTEIAAKGVSQIKAIRKDTDAAINLILDSLNISLVTGPSATITDFIAQLNTRIQYYNTVVNERIGRAKAKEQE
ncbi:MAG: DUF6261 family protein [Verrucomicrobiales bacterium]|jgi:hypothetical protein|nr:DUF6261 family protein [Verrucomicrobiales bacterium]